MVWRAVIVGLAAAAVFAVVVLIYRRTSAWLKRHLQRLLGDYFEYASIFGVLILTLLAVAAFSFFVLPFVIWVAGVCVVLVSTVLLVLIS